MATVSMIDVLSKHADYFIASSRDEPITGWDYRNWITMLSDDTSMEAAIYDDVKEELKESILSEAKQSK